MPAERSPLVAEARKRWERCAEHEEPQRKAILEDKKFRAGEQWPDDIREQRQGAPAIQGQAAQPPRPCLTIDRLSQPVRQISNQIKSANFAIDVLPNGNGSDKDTADIFKGILRRIQNQSRGDSPIEWAADGAVEGGIGWFRLRTDYVYQTADIDGPELFDQEIRIDRILNNLTVYCDPGAVKPTRADARFMFVTEDLAREEYRRRYPKRADGKDSELASLDFSTTGDKDSWITDDMIRIAEYWRVEDEKTKVYILKDGTIQKGGDKPDAELLLKEREVVASKVKCSIINSVEELESYEWAGSHIPLIPVLGEELNVDGRAVLRGVISEGKDAQRMVNYMYSGAIETVALAPKSPIIIAEGQLEGYKNIWQNANRFNYAYLPYKPTSLNGTPVPPPARDQAEPAIQAMVLMLAKSEDAIKATTGIWDPSLGNTSPREKSGRAIQALQGQSDLGSSNYGDNVRRALIYAGEQIVEVLPKITRPGQIMTILSQDEKPEQIVIGQPFEQQNGQAKPLSKDEAAARQAEKGIVKFYDLKAGTYSVTVAVGKAYATRREEGRSALGELIPNLPPPMAAVLTPEYIENLDMPNAHAMAERARDALPPELRAKDEKDQPDPAQLQQQIQQAMQMIQAMTQELNAKNQIIETDGVKAQAKLQETAISEQSANQRELAKIQSAERQSALDNLVKLAIAEIAAQRAEAEQHAEMARTQLGFQHEHAQNEQQRAADAHLQRAKDVNAAYDRAYQAGEAERGRQFEGSQAERDRQVSAEDAERARAFEADQAERSRQAEAEARDSEPVE